MEQTQKNPETEKKTDAPATAPVVIAETPKEKEVATPTKGWPWKAFIAGVVVAVGGHYIYTTLQAPATEKMDGEFPAVVAIVNGEELTATELENSITQVKALAASTASETEQPKSESEITEEALELITNTRLLVQAARASEIEIEEAAIDQQIEILETNFGGAAALERQASSLGLSPEDLRMDIEEQLLVDLYLRSTIDIEAIEVTSEEIQAFYDEVVEGGQQLPPLESISAQIELQIQGQKQDEMINELIASLRNEAAIEVLLK